MPKIISFLRAKAYLGSQFFFGGIQTLLPFGRQ